MNFVLTWPWIQSCSGSTVVVIDQAWHSALKPAGNVWKKKRTKDRKEVVEEISKMRMSCRNGGWRSFAKNRKTNVRKFLQQHTAYGCLHVKVKLLVWQTFQVKWNGRCTLFLSMWTLDSFVGSCSRSILLTLHSLLSVSSVNKHKPWIETSYHGVITENTDIVLLDPPLVALDKDAPIPYAGTVHFHPNGCQLDHSNRAKARLTQTKWRQSTMTQVLIHTGKHRCRIYLH